jgi:hypothetical protein
MSLPALETDVGELMEKSTSSESGATGAGDDVSGRVIGGCHAENSSFGTRPGPFSDNDMP